jgi:hypothetical protein
MAAGVMKPVDISFVSGGSQLNGWRPACCDSGQRVASQKGTAARGQELQKVASPKTRAAGARRTGEAHELWVARDPVVRRALVALVDLCGGKLAL